MVRLPLLSLRLETAQFKALLGWLIAASVALTPATTTVLNAFKINPHHLHPGTTHQLSETGWVQCTEVARLPLKSSR